MVIPLWAALRNDPAPLTSLGTTPLRPARDGALGTG
jgi:hypothetical protein